MPEVTIIHGTNKMIVSAAAGQTLGELLCAHIPSFAMPCAGNHTCGKCLIRVEGAVSPADGEERCLLGERASEPGLRLACCCKVAGNAVVTIPTAGAAEILSWYKTPKMQAAERGYGFAVDIGTTTVAMQLIDRASGRVAAERVADNAQRGFGADVISRIEACKLESVKMLSDRIAGQLEEMAAACLLESGVSGVEESVVTGNTTMLHIYEGLDPASLASAPFAVQSYFGCMSRRTLADASVYLPRCIGAYVGADITCAILAADLTGGGVQMLADIGTNGEIVLARDGGLLCCSTAAGPAFEGAGLSCGMKANMGAVCGVKHISGDVVYETIGDAAAVGICGSGILDALAVMLETGAMDDTGHIDKEEWPVGNSGISITQRDIRQIQLAKSAICAGILTLLDHESLKTDDIDRFIIAGGFGNSMDHMSASAIGLYPQVLREKAVFEGNGALGGAVMLLRSGGLREKAACMASEAVELSLSASSAFVDHYVDCMSFETF